MRYGARRQGISTSGRWGQKVWMGGRTMCARGAATFRSEVPCSEIFSYSHAERDWRDFGSMSDT